MAHAFEINRTPSALALAGTLDSPEIRQARIDHGRVVAGEGQPFAWAGQTSLKFYERLAVDEDYNGLALDASEGERIARAAGTADVVMLKNHGPLVLGPSIAEAWDDLYYLERAAEVQLKAMASGRPLQRVPHEVASAACRQMQIGNAESARLHLESVKRQLARTEPEFAV